MKYPGGNFREHMLTQNLEAFRTHCAIPMASLLRRSSVRGHRSEIMFGVLVVVLRGDPVAGLGFGLGQRQISLIVSLCVMGALQQFVRNGRKKLRAPMGGSLYQFRSEDLLALERILDAADGVLDLAFYLIGLAFAFRLLVAGHLPNDFLHFAFRLFQRTFHAVSVDHK